MVVVSSISSPRVSLSLTSLSRRPPRALRLLYLFRAAPRAPLRRQRSPLLRATLSRTSTNGAAEEGGSAGASGGEGEEEADDHYEEVEGEQSSRFYTPASRHLQSISMFLDHISGSRGAWES